ncbi:hypothetical protein V6N13_069932 [Hibiscus sabdariffa]|uniref:Uncharacterized protein n=1 Tax=Hibiscus sabdariffa TaxID=183260 RepID=A0ABR2BJ01_9ROSI
MNRPHRSDPERVGGSRMAYWVAMQASIVHLMHKMEMKTWFVLLRSIDRIGFDRERTFWEMRLEGAAAAVVSVGWYASAFVRGDREIRFSAEEMISF